MKKTFKSLFASLCTTSLLLTTFGTTKANEIDAVTRIFSYAVAEDPQTQDGLNIYKIDSNGAATLLEKNIFPELNVGNIGQNVKYYDAGSQDLAINCYKNLLNNDIIGLEKHGTLSIGNNIDEIFENIETLEYYIKIFLNSK